MMQEAFLSLFALATMTAGACALGPDQGGPVAAELFGITAITDSDVDGYDTILYDEAGAEIARYHHTAAELAAVAGDAAGATDPRQLANTASYSRWRSQRADAAIGGCCEACWSDVSLGGGWTYSAHECDGWCLIYSGGGTFEKECYSW